MYNKSFRYKSTGTILSKKVCSPYRDIGALRMNKHII